MEKCDLTRIAVLWSFLTNDVDPRAVVQGGAVQAPIAPVTAISSLKTSELSMVTVKESSGLVPSIDEWGAPSPLQRLAWRRPLSARSQTFFYTILSAGGPGWDEVEESYSHR
jgi:hypothetical protein